MTARATRMTDPLDGPVDFARFGPVRRGPRCWAGSGARAERVPASGLRSWRDDLDETTSARAYPSARHEGDGTQRSPLPPAIFIGSAITNAPRVGRSSSAARFSKILT